MEWIMRREEIAVNNGEVVFLINLTTEKGKRED
jgi:hypothetical protein